MILKANDKLYNCDGWRRIDREDEWLEISFFQLYEVDGEPTSWKHVIEMVDDDYYTTLFNKHKDFDYKDIREIKWCACAKAYDLIIQKFADGFDYLDLDLVIDQEQLCNEAVAEYLKEFEDDNVKCESNS